MPAFLTFLNTELRGAKLSLKDSATNRLGRDEICEITLDDPLASRVHATLWRDKDGWWIRDTESRNGTFLNQQKIDFARLVDGQIVRIGQTELVFREVGAMTTSLGSQPLSETLVIDRPCDLQAVLRERAKPSEASQVAEDTQLRHLYALSLKLLQAQEPSAVVVPALELLRQRSRASMAGLLWVDESGQLQPQFVLPTEAGAPLQFSRRLNELVVQGKHAIHVNLQHQLVNTQSLGGLEEAICVPLLAENQTVLGAIHLYSDTGPFEESALPLAIDVASMLVIALPRAFRWSELVSKCDRLVDAIAEVDDLLGESTGMRELKKKIVRIARAAGCVLIRGESGCGKELVARAIHRTSPRSQRPMLSVNCAAIPRELMESQLFGHRKGAFTGADADHMGWFEQAHSGTLFLDEVGELTLEGQAKLLRVLEGHPFLPVGARNEVRVDVRVIAATNRDLSEFVRSGRFREDLYYRLSVFELVIPPLRERGADIGLLVDFFFDHFCRQHGRPELQLTPTARRQLLAYHWPGNVRQLRNVLDSAVVLAEGDAVSPEDLGLRDVSEMAPHTLNIEWWEQKLIRMALDRTAGSIPEASKLLGIGRATLYRKLESLPEKP
jgi:two-component system response regulator HydG